MKIKFFTLIVFISILAVWSPVRAQEAEEAEEPENIGWVTEVTGRATVLHPFKDKPEGVEQGSPVFLEDEINTSVGANITVQFDDGSVITLGSDTRLKISEWVYRKAGKENRSYFKLFKGRVRGLLKNLFGGFSEMKVETPTSIVGVKGSDLSVWIEDGETFAAVLEGEGFIRHIERGRFPGEVKIKAGHMVSVRKGRAVKKSFRIPRDVGGKIKKLRVKRHKRLIKKFRKEWLKKKKLKKKPGYRIRFGPFWKGGPEDKETR
jgi:hypothetical protein